jgi:hypothetical protein
LQHQRDGELKRESLRPFDIDVAKDYVELIRPYVDGKVSAGEFQSKFVKTYLKDEVGELFRLLDRFFADVECYDAGCTPEDETGARICERTLRTSAEGTLNKLESLLRQ